MKVSIDLIARILHQRDTSVTQYYSQPTAEQVREAAETIFIDRIDVAAEARRSPEEIGRMLREAEGKIGALTQVIGGTCIIGNFCPAKFACIGCSGNAPDPERRAEVERKKEWAAQHLNWAIREGLGAEGRQMRQLIQDCELMLEEMDMIIAARENAAQTITVIHGSDGIRK
jgi:hypothetical protein